MRYFRRSCGSLSPLQAAQSLLPNAGVFAGDRSHVSSRYCEHPTGLTCILRNRIGAKIVYGIDEN
jgi:hypothetical protein